MIKSIKKNWYRFKKNDNSDYSGMLKLGSPLLKLKTMSKERENKNEEIDVEKYRF